MVGDPTRTGSKAHPGLPRASVGSRIKVVITACRSVSSRGAPQASSAGRSPIRAVRRVEALSVAARSWASALEWLSDLAGILAADAVWHGLAERPLTVRARLGYLLQGSRPDLVVVLGRTGPGGWTWFGPRGKLCRHATTWQIAGTLLPIDPRTLAPRHARSPARWREPAAVPGRRRTCVLRLSTRRAVTRPSC